MRRNPLGVVVLTLAASSVSAAELGECVTIKDDAVRLYCYDRVAGRTDATTTAPAAAPAAATAAPASGAATSEAPSGRIESRLVGTFSGWRPGTRFKLENGQTWEVISMKTYNGRIEAPNVVIERDFLGQSHFAVEGVKPRAIVRRADDE